MGTRPSYENSKTPLSDLLTSSPIQHLRPRPAFSLLFEPIVQLPNDVVRIVHVRVLENDYR